MARVTSLLVENGCELRSAAVWTHHGRAAYVMGVTERGCPIRDESKLEALQQLLLSLMNSDKQGYVNVETVRLHGV